MHVTSRVLLLVVVVAASPTFAQTAPLTPTAPEPVAPASIEAEPKPEGKLAWYDKLALSGFIQAQFVTNETSGDGVDAQGRPENLDRFEVRRARLKVTYRANPAEAVLHIDALPSGFRVLEAEASGRIAWHGDAYTKFTAGLFRIPFGWELQESMSTHPFPERSLWANRLFPGVRDVGARIWGAAWNEALVYQLAVQNGHLIGDSTFPALDPNGFKDFVGRLGTKLGPLRAGVSGLIGKGYLAPEQDDAATPEDEAHGAINYDRWAVGADVVLGFDLEPLGELGLYTEAVYAENLDRANTSNLPAIVLDASGDATESVTDENHLGVYAGVQQRFGRYIAAGARYDHFDPNSDASDDQKSALTLLVHGYPSDPIRLTVAYELRFEEPSVDDNQLWLRAQVKY